MRALLLHVSMCALNLPSTDEKTLYSNHPSPQVRAPLMQRSCARVASFIFDDLGEVLSEGAFATEIEHLRSEDCNGARRVALRNELEKLHAWLHEKCDETNLDDLHDSYGLFSKYLDATENGDDNEQGRVVLVDA